MYFTNSSTLFCYYYDRIMLACQSNPCHFHLSFGIFSWEITTCQLSKHRNSFTGPVIYNRLKMVRLTTSNNKRRSTKGLTPQPQPICVRPTFSFFIKVSAHVYSNLDLIQLNQNAILICNIIFIYIQCTMRHMFTLL